MKITAIVALAAAMASGFVYGQAQSQVTCKSMVNPDNIKVFEGEHCPFGWAKIERREGE